MADLAAINGIAIASIASINGIAIASVTAWDGFSIASFTPATIALLAEYFAGTNRDAINVVNLSTLITSSTGTTLGSARRDGMMLPGPTYAAYAGGTTTAAQSNSYHIDWSTYATSAGNALAYVNATAAQVPSPTGGVLLGGAAPAATTFAMTWTSATDTYTQSPPLYLAVSDRYLMGVKVSSAHGYTLSGDLRTDLHDVVFATGTTRISTTMPNKGFRGSGSIAQSGVAAYFSGGYTAPTTLGNDAIDKVTDGGVASVIAAVLPAKRRLNTGVGDGSTFGLWIGGDNSGTYYATAYKLDYASETTSAVPGADATAAGWWDGVATGGQ